MAEHGTRSGGPSGGDFGGDLCGDFGGDAGGDPLPTVWRRSSRSGSNNEDCVEVGVPGRPGAVLVRDSKDSPGRTLAFASADWAAFLAGLAGGPATPDAGRRRPTRR